MHRQVDTIAKARSRPFYYYVCASLLVAAIATTLVQKQREAAVAASMAQGIAVPPGGTQGANMKVDRAMRDATPWQVLSLSLSSLAVLSWGMAIWRHEKHCWIRVVALLLLFAGLQLILV